MFGRRARLHPHSTRRDYRRRSWVGVEASKNSWSVPHFSHLRHYFRIVTGCCCGTREFVRVSRRWDPDNPFNSAIAGVFSGAILGRLQGGLVGADKYSVIFAAAGTALDFTTYKLKERFRNMSEEEKKNWFKLPGWSPIQVLDEEALAKREAREKQLYVERVLGKLNKEES